MIRVAYDLSFLGGKAVKGTGITGIGRVIHEVGVRLAELPDVQMHAVGCFAHDWNPIRTEALARRAALNMAVRGLSPLATCHSRTGIGRWLGSWQNSWEDVSVGSENSASQSLLRLYRRLVKLDLARKLSTDAVDIYHSTFLPAPEFIPPSMPRVVTIYDVIPARYPDQCTPAACGMMNAILKSLRPDYDIVLAISEFTKRDFAELTNFPLERVVVAPLAASAHFQPVSETRFLDQVRATHGLGMRPFLLTVSNPQPRKNLPRLIRSFYQLLNEQPDWDGDLVLVGNAGLGWGSQEIEQAVMEQPPLATRVRRIGPVSDSDLAALYSACVAFVFPSLYEGFGLPVLEALQCGAPVICSHSTSLPEITGAAALLVDPEDDSALTQSMRQMLNDSALQRRLSVDAVAQAQAFSWDRCAKTVLGAYQLAVDGRVG